MNRHRFLALGAAGALWPLFSGWEALRGLFRSPGHRILGIDIAKPGTDHAVITTGEYSFPAQRIINCRCLLMPFPDIGRRLGEAARRRIDRVIKETL